MDDSRPTTVYVETSLRSEESPTTQWVTNGGAERERQLPMGTAGEGHKTASPKIL